MNSKHMSIKDYKIGVKYTPKDAYGSTTDDTFTAEFWVMAKSEEQARGRAKRAVEIGRGEDRVGSTTVLEVQDVTSDE